VASGGPALSSVLQFTSMRRRQAIDCAVHGCASLVLLGGFFLRLVSLHGS
jgi:hypothetical protein